VGLSSSKLTSIFTTNSFALGLPIEEVSVFTTVDALRMVTFYATVFFSIGGICLAYALQRGPLNLTVLSVCTLSPIVAGIMTRFTIHEDN